MAQCGYSFEFEIGAGVGLGFEFTSIFLNMPISVEAGYVEKDCIVIDDGKFDVVHKTEYSAGLGLSLLKTCASVGFNLSEFSQRLDEIYYK